MLDNKMLVSLGGVIICMPAKPVIALAAIGAVTVVVSGYYILKEDC